MKGRKITCVCGNCRKCRLRGYKQESRRKRSGVPPLSEQQERELIEKLDREEARFRRERARLWPMEQAG